MAASAGNSYLYCAKKATQLLKRKYPNKFFQRQLFPKILGSNNITITSSPPLSPNSSNSTVHLHPPPRPKPLHRPNNHSTPGRQSGHAGEQPAIPQRLEQRLGHHDADGAHDVADAIVERDPGRGAARHEFREHGDDGAEDEHATDAEEEVGYEL